MPGARRNSGWYLIAAAFLLSATAASAEGNKQTEPHRGEPLFQKHCAGCHSTRPRDHGIGPSLFGVVGRKAAVVIDYDYSQAMKTFDRVWDGEALDAYMTDPQQAVPGTKSNFSGIKDAGDRMLLRDFLETRCGCSVRY